MSKIHQSILKDVEMTSEQIGAVVLEWDISPGHVVIIADNEVVMSLSLADILQASGQQNIKRALEEIECRQDGYLIDEDNLKATVTHIQ